MKKYSLNALKTTIDSRENGLICMQSYSEKNTSFFMISLPDYKCNLNSTSQK